MKLKLNIKSSKPKLKERGKKLKLNIKSNKPKLKIRNIIKRHKLKSYIKNSKEILRILSQCRVYRSSGDHDSLDPRKIEVSHLASENMIIAYMKLIEENKNLLIDVEYGNDWVRMKLHSLTFPNTNYTHSILFKHHGPTGVRGKK